MTEQQIQEMYDFFQRMKAMSSVDAVELLKAHKHNKHDFPGVDAKDLEGVLGLSQGGTGVALVDPNADRLLFWDDSAGQFKFLTLGTGLSISDTTINGSADPSFITVTAGETLAAGDLVRLYVAGANLTQRGYDQVSGTTYAIRAAANDTTYGAHVLGIVHEAITYLSTGRVRILGPATGLTGLTSGSNYYLDNYSGASSETITQTSQNAEFNILSTNILRQVFIPTSSRLDKVILYARRNGGAGTNMTVELRRSNTVLATASLDLGANSASLAEKTFDFSDVQTYKGELLNLKITCDNDFGYIGYRNGGDVYAPVYGPTGSADNIDLFLDSGAGTIASDSDLYMKVFEYTNFGKLNTTAGTRKFKIGQAYSTTELAMAIQYGDSIL